LGFTGSAHAASVEEASKAEIKSATEAFQLGVEALDTGRYEQALDSFQRSYATVASPNSRMMVGRSLVKLGRLPEAYRELSRTISDANASAQNQKKYKMTLETAQKELDELKPKLSFIKIRPLARVVLLGKELDSSDWLEPQPVMPGAVALELTFPNGRKLQQQLSLKPGETSEFALETPAKEQATPQPIQTTKAMQAAPTGAINRKTAGYVLGGVGIVGIGAFVGFGLLGASSYGDSYAECTSTLCPSTAVDNEGKKSLLKGIGYAGLGIGVLGLGAASWLLLSDGGGAPRTALGVSPGRVQLEHRF
jgi:hypothetical protein